MFLLAFVLKMSGLDVEKEHILEIACIVTDKELNVIAEVSYFHGLYFIIFPLKCIIEICSFS